MALSRAERIVRDHLEAADILVGGGRPWDIDVRDPRLFPRVLRAGPVGLGDAYVQGWWECESLDVFFDRVFRADLPALFRWRPVTVGGYVKEKCFNLQSRPRARGNSESHYNRGNDLFRAMLDRRMMYSCACWRGAATLDEAQETKLEMICRKLGLAPGQRVLDIGCGWGGFAQYAAERFGCEVVGVNLSSEQAEAARLRCRGLPVEIRIQDYRELDERFDRVVSIGMFEHVGPKNHRRFMRVVSRCMKEDALCLLHFFATRRTWPNLQDTEVIWIQRRIFPGVIVPSLRQVGAAVDGLFVAEDMENIGAHYDPTLMAWFANFDRAWPRLRDAYGDRFYRLWKYYLLTCAGAFRARKHQLWQFVLSKTGVPGGWTRPAVRSEVASAPLNAWSADAQGARGPSGSPSR